MRNLDGAANVENGLALGDQLVRSFDMANDLIGCVADSFHGGVPEPVRPDEGSHTVDQFSGATPVLKNEGPNLCYRTWLLRLFKDKTSFFKNTY